MSIIEDLDMVKNSNKARSNCTQIIIMNGKIKGKKTKLKLKMDMSNNISYFNEPFEMDKIDGKLIKQQAVFRAGKSCTRKMLNLVEEIEKML